MLLGESRQILLEKYWYYISLARGFIFYSDEASSC